MQINAIQLVKCAALHQINIIWEIDFGFKFRILPDNIQTVTTIFNSKTTCITNVDTGISSLRIDLLDESIEEINLIAKSSYNKEKLEGKQFTYGNLNRDV